MNSILETLGILFIIVLSFVFHILVYEDDYIEKWYWKLLAGISILVISFAILLY
jgi:hypothetical protein